MPLAAWISLRPMAPKGGKARDCQFLGAFAFALCGALLTGCAITTTTATVQPPQLVRNNNNGSDEYKIVIKGAGASQAIQLGVEQAQRFCRSLERKTEILLKTYAAEPVTQAAEVSFYCWDLELAAKLHDQKQRSVSPSN